MLINLNVSYTSTILSCISKHITKSRLFLQKKHHKGLEATFLIRAFGFSEELSTGVGFAFYNNGLKSQDLWFRMNKILWYFDNISWFQILPWNSYHTWENSITEKALYNAYSIMQFFVWKRHWEQWYAKCVVTIQRPNLKSWNIIKKTIL